VDVVVEGGPLGSRLGQRGRGQEPAQLFLDGPGGADLLRRVVRGQDPGQPVPGTGGQGVLPAQQQQPVRPGQVGLAAATVVAVHPACPRVTSPNTRTPSRGSRRPVNAHGSQGRGNHAELVARGVQAVQQPAQAINGRLEHLRGSALGFTNLTNYIARSLLETGGFRPQLHPGL
jgi:hypothetical protein